MSRIISFLLLSLICMTIHGQNRKIDSLQALIKTTKADTARIQIHGRLAVEYTDLGDSTQAFHHAYHALGLADHVDDRYYRAIAYSNLGYSHLHLLHLDSVRYYYSNMLDMLAQDTSYQSKRLKVVANNNLAYAYSAQGNMRKALSTIISTLPITKELGNKDHYRAMLHNIAASFVSFHEYDKAYPYMKEDVALADKGNFTAESQAETYINAAILLKHMDSLDQEGAMLKKSLHYLKKMGPHHLWGRYYCQHARYLAKLGKITEARENLDKAWDEVKNGQHATNEYDFYVAKTDVEWAAGNQKAAREASLRLYDMSMNDQDHTYASFVCKDIADLSREMGDYKMASQYMEKYVTLKDSIDHEQTLMDMSEMEAQHRTSEKEKEIIRLQAEKKETALTQRNQRLLNWLFGIGAAISLLAFIFAAYIYRNRQRQIASELQELEQQKQLELTQAVLEGEERERQRIARDLHDGLGGTLSGIKIKLSGEQKQSTTPVIEETILQLEDSIGELRRIARNMMPETLIRSGLEVALRDLCVSLSSDETIIEFQPSALGKDMPIQSQVNIYRIIQELLTNAIRHGRASKIIVQCIQDQHHILITVEDNGQGMDHQKSPESNGIGLNNVQNRVDLLKGNLQIESAIGEGTTVHVELDIA